MAYFDSFEINIVRALADQLVEAFAQLESAPLVLPAIADLPQGQGVYQLFLDGSLVYVGKADSLRKRLGEHHQKVLGRQNISLEQMGFKALFVHPNWTALAPEDSLIKYYRKSGAGECPWNGNGFGPHDPGRERETTNKAPDGFDAQYPIKADWPCDWIGAGSHNCQELLEKVKKGLPYLLRYGTANPKNWRNGHPDFNTLEILVPFDEMPADELLIQVCKRIPGWQLTQFPGHFIMYKEKRDYTHGLVLWPK